MVFKGDQEIGSLTFKSNQLLTSLLPKQTLKGAINLPSVRKNSKDKMKSILVRNLTIFSHLLLIANLQRSIQKIVTRSWLTINSSDCYIQDYLSTKAPGLLTKMSDRWLFPFPDASANKRIDSTIASTRKHRNSLASKETTSSWSRIAIAPTLHSTKRLPIY